jgi:hypothetical protein
MTNSMKLIFVIAFLFFCGCVTLITPKNASTYQEPDLINLLSVATSAQRQVIRQELIQRHPEWDAKTNDAILNETILIGMDKTQVMAVMGRCHKIKTSTTAQWVNEQWVYGDHAYYLYFENGILRTIQN